MGKWEEFERERRDSSSTEIEEVAEKLDHDLATLEAPNFASTIREAPYLSGRSEVRAEKRALYKVDAVDVITYVFAALFLIMPMIIPEYQVAYIFGLALLMTVLIRSLLARIAAVFFTATYFVLFMVSGFYFELGEVMSFIFGINTISLVPVIVGSLMAILAMGGGLAWGLSGSNKYAGIWIIALALVISVADALVAVFILGMLDWYVIFSLHLGIYMAALVVSFVLFYLAARLVRYSVLSALR